jgi:hypothetical protein
VIDKDKAIWCKETFDTDSGKRFLEVLSGMCNENKPTYIDGNPNGSAYKEGQRSIILGIRNMLNADLGREIKRKAVR